MSRAWPCLVQGTARGMALPSCPRAKPGQSLMVGRGQATCSLWCLLSASFSPGFFLLIVNQEEPIFPPSPPQKKIHARLEAAQRNICALVKASQAKSWGKEKKKVLEKQGADFSCGSGMGAHTSLLLPLLHLTPLFNTAERGCISVQQNTAKTEAFPRKNHCSPTLHRPRLATPHHCFTSGCPSSATQYICHAVI